MLTEEQVVGLKKKGPGDHICALTLATRVRAAVESSQPAAADQRVSVSWGQQQQLWRSRSNPQEVLFLLLLFTGSLRLWTNENSELRNPNPNPARETEMYALTFQLCCCSTQCDVTEGVDSPRQHQGGWRWSSAMWPWLCPRNWLILVSRSSNCRRLQTED